MSASDRLRSRRARAAGLTLVEVIVATTLFGLLIAAVLSSFVFILRSERSLANYTEMNAEARGMLELLGRDAKSAVAVTNFTATRLTLVVPTNTSGGTAEVTYELDAAAGRLVRATGGQATTLVGDVGDLVFRYLNSNNAVTTSLAELKQVQLSLRILRQVSRASTSQHVISAQYTLRAKPTAH